jgi:Lon protease-like protein
MSTTTRVGPALVRAMSGCASSSAQPAACGMHTSRWHTRGLPKHNVRLMKSPIAASHRGVCLTRWPVAATGTRRPSAFRTYGAAPGGEAGSVDDSFDHEDGGARDFFAELKWLPPLDPSKDVELVDTTQNPTTMVMPVFPLGSTAYMPHSDHVLNIFEPRYRSMYSDILFNGSRRFVVPVSHPTTGELAAVAPVFYLEDLKEVSEQTADAVKYVCSHKVIGRVRITRTLNDKVWADRSTYLKAVVTPLEDVDDDEDLSTKEQLLKERFVSIIAKQTKLGEPVRFTENLVDTLSAERGEDGLWRLAGLWQSLLQNRLSAKESELSNDIQVLLRNYLTKQGKDMQSKVTVQFDKLPQEIRNEFTRLQQTFREETLAMVGQTIYPFTLLVQCDSHAERLNVFGSMLEEEEKRLQAKVALQSLFNTNRGDSSAGEDGDKPASEEA